MFHLSYQLLRNVRKICNCCKRKSPANPFFRQIQTYSAKCRTQHCIATNMFFTLKKKHFAILTNAFSNPCFRRIQMYSANCRLLPQRTVPDLRLADGGSSEDSDISSKPSFIFPQTFVVQICLKIGCSSISQRIENNTFLCRVEKCWRRWSWAILEFSYIRYHRGPRVKGVDGITKI